MSDGLEPKATDDLAAGDALEIVGTTIEGKYLIEKVVGEGGFALVYRAMHLVWKRPVAIKAFRALAELDDAQRDKLVEEFIREGALLAELSERSAAIVQARDVGTLVTKTGLRVPYMILEWLDGATLEAVLVDEAARGLPVRAPQEAIELLNPIAEALALAHKRGIAHRDVKPANVFVLGDARGEHAMKLLDFGIAKVVQDAQKMSGSFQKTGGHITSFTPAYGAPEQFSRSHGATGPWTDVFSFALMIAEVLSGKPPLDGDSFVQLGFMSADRSRRPTPRTLGATVTDAVEEVFVKALAVACDDRYQTAGEFWNALRGALPMAPIRTLGDLTTSNVNPAESAAFGATVPVNELTPPMVPAIAAPPPTHRKPNWIVIGAVAVAALAGVVVAYGKIKGSGPPSPIASAPAMSASVAPPVPSAPLAHCPEGSVLVPGGEFYMGTDHPPDALANEMPAHPVMLSPYCMDGLEVTTVQYFACVDMGKCLRADSINRIKPELDVNQKQAYDPVCNMNDMAKRAKHPINCVDFDQATKYCAVHTGRLPTEAEWEFAARGPDGRAYPWGDEAPNNDKANACGSECVAWAKEHKVEADFPGQMYATNDGFATTAPVGSFPAGKSRYGIEDVVGNVWEWTSDFYALYSKDSHTTLSDPKGPIAGDARVIRGGAWNSTYPEWARPTFRFKAPPDERTHGIGFRCVYSSK